MGEPKYRRPLSKDQIHTLLIVCKFRFVSVASLAASNGGYKSVSYSRLKILYDQGYIGRRYDSSYRLQGKSASYYLLPKAIKLLKAKSGKIIDPRVVRNMHKNSSVSQEFIDHCLNSLTIYIRFKQFYGSKLTRQYYSRTEIARFDYFLTPRPDAYFRLKYAQQDQEFVLENLEEATPWFVIKKRIKQYIDHVDDGVWSESGVDSYPIVLLICNTDKLYKRLIRHIRKTLEDSYAFDLLFGLTTTEVFLSSPNKQAKIWLPVSDTIGKPMALGELGGGRGVI